MGALMLAGALSAALAAGAAQGGLLNGQVRHGAQLAQRCEACHAIGQADHGRNSRALAFRVLARRNNPIGLEQALRRIVKSGHYQMRPVAISESDATDIAAYIATLAEPPTR